MGHESEIANQHQERARWAKAEDISQRGAEKDYIRENVRKIMVQTKFRSPMLFSTSGTIRKVGIILLAM